MGTRSLTVFYDDDGTTRISLKRYSDALAIDAGACNPIAIALSIVSACREVKDSGGDTNSIRKDSALKLMVHQLSFLLGMEHIGWAGYSLAVEGCERMAAKGDG